MLDCTHDRRQAHVCLPVVSENSADLDSPWGDSRVIRFWFDGVGIWRRSGAKTDLWPLSVPKTQTQLHLSTSKSQTRAAVTPPVLIGGAIHQVPVVKSIQRLLRHCLQWGVAISSRLRSMKVDRSHLQEPELSVTVMVATGVDFSLGFPLGFRSVRSR